jgi:hypothetical protein
MHRNAIVTLAVGIVLLALGSQVAIPAYVSSRVEDRLTAHGGSAHVTVHAVPALQLIKGSGQSIDVTGEDLTLDVPRAAELDKLDGFDQVHVDITRARTGPFTVRRLRLDRSSRASTYRMTFDAVARPSQLTKYAVGRAGSGPLYDLMGGFAADLLPQPDDPTAIHLAVELRSDGGVARVIAADGGAGGIKPSTLATDLLGVVANRL